jgi:hypothetical protein
LEPFGGMRWEDVHFEVFEVEIFLVEMRGLKRSDGEVGDGRRRLILKHCNDDIRSGQALKCLVG